MNLPKHLSPRWCSSFGLLGLNLLPAMMGHNWNRVRVEHVLQEVGITATSIAMTLMR